jgi:hypothetical protein
VPRRVARDGAAGSEYSWLPVAALIGVAGARLGTTTQAQRYGLEETEEEATDRSAVPECLACHPRATRSRTSGMSDTNEPLA